jgi:hypothetical protein
LSPNFKVNRDLVGLSGPKPSKSKILDIRE